MSRAELVLCAGFRGVIECAAQYVARQRDRNRDRNPLALAEIALLVPTAAAAHLLRRRIEDAVLERPGRAAILPTITTPQAIAQADTSRLVDPLLREALVEASFDAVRKEGLEPPFPVRGTLAARVLDLYDEILLRGGERESFMQRALEELDVPDDEGALRLAQQTRFLDGALGEYRRRLQSLNLIDPPDARGALSTMTSRYRTIVVCGAETLAPLELAALTVKSSPAAIQLLAEWESAGPLKRYFATVPDEGGISPPPPPPPRLLAPKSAPDLCFLARDREEVLRNVARLLKLLDSEGRLPPLHRVAVVVPRPLPYLYLAKKVFHEAGVPFELEDTFPLAREPVVAAVDLALDLIEHDASRSTALALMRSPFFVFPDVAGPEIAAFDRWTARLRETGSLRRWGALLANKSRRPVQPSLPGLGGGSSERALKALGAVVAAGATLGPLRAKSPLNERVDCVRAFLARFARPLEEACPASELERARRARLALDSILERLSSAAEQAGSPELDLPAFREKLRRAIGSHTFAHRSGSERVGVAVVDRRSAAFGSFDLVLLLGLNEGEWPERGERNIFYPQRLLHPFGWPSDREVLASERRHFGNLLGLASKHVVLFRHQLEDEIPAVASPFLEDADGWLRASGAEPERLRTELEPVVVSRAEALRRGLVQSSRPALRVERAGIVENPPRVAEPVSPTSFELHLSCPFKYFCRYLLRIEEEEVIDQMLSPLERGRILHEILHDAFAQWDGEADGPRAITEDCYDDALALFRRVSIAKLPGPQRRMELSRLFGNAGEPGAIPWLLRRELARGTLTTRLVEHGFEAPLRVAHGPAGQTPWYVRIKGRVDRADVDADGYLHVFDYKSGRAPATATTLQVPLYAMSLAQELGVPVREAAYLSFRDRKSTARADFDEAIERLTTTHRRVSAGDFSPRPYREQLCDTCGFVGVCRKQIEEKPP